MKPLSYFDFNRKRFIRLLRENTKKYIICCKLYRSDNKKLAIQKFESIIDETNRSLQKQETFESNNIFLILEKLNEFGIFIHEFSTSIKNTEDISALNDRHIAFFDRQQKLETFLKENRCNMKPITELIQ